MTGYELLTQLLAAKSRYEEIQGELAAVNLSVQRNRPETMTINDCRNLLETFTVLLTTAMEEAQIGGRVVAGWSEALLQVRYCGRPLFEDGTSA